MKIRIISYNILSSELVDPERYTFCTEDDLNSDRRYDEIEKVLRAEVHRNSIICLQEVSLTWAARLQVFFNPLNYRVVKAQYSSRFSGYMGCFTAFPDALYKLGDCRYTSPFHTKLAEPTPGVVSRGLKWAMGVNRKYFLPALVSAPCLAFLVDKWLGTSTISLGVQHGLPLYALGATLATADCARENFFPTPGKFKSPNLVEGVTARHRDVMPMVKLQERKSGKEFWVANTHMPCKFYNQKLMGAFAWHIGHQVQEVAQETPYVLVGDFNAKPTDVVYEMYTTGQVSPSHPDRPSFPAEPEWEPNLTPLRSAYADHNGSEPPFTNYSRITIDGVVGDPFVEVLDYIWLSSSWKVEDVVSLPEESCVASFPSIEAKQPSDHVMIGATLSL